MNMLIKGLRKDFIKEFFFAFSIFNPNAEIDPITDVRRLVITLQEIIFDQKKKPEEGAEKIVSYLENIGSI